MPRRRDRQPRIDHRRPRIGGVEFIAENGGGAGVRLRKGGTG
jgi:hypothetical protein